MYKNFKYLCSAEKFKTMIMLSSDFKTLSSVQGILEKQDSKVTENLSSYFPLNRKPKPRAKAPGTCRAGWGDGFQPTEATVENFISLRFYDSCKNEYDLISQEC